MSDELKRQAALDQENKKTVLEQRGALDRTNKFAAVK